MDADVSVARYLMIGRIHHTDRVRANQQLAQCELLARELRLAGFSLRHEAAYRQVPFVARERLLPRDYLKVARTFWRQQEHHLTESRRRMGKRGPIPMKKRHKSMKQLITLVASASNVRKALQRGFIEEALAKKHIQIWKLLAESDAFGAIVVEDDFSLRSSTSAGAIVGLINSYGSSFDLIDLAGGFSREKLGLSGMGGGDLRIDFMLANTTCGYFISQRAAASLVTAVAENPSLIQLGSDFLIETLNRRSFAGKTVLPEVLPMVHGSLEGIVPSTIPY